MQANTILFADVVRRVLKHSPRDPDGWYGIDRECEMLSEEHLASATLDGIFLVVDHLFAHLNALVGDSNAFHTVSEETRAKALRDDGVRTFCWHQSLLTGGRAVANFANRVLAWHDASRTVVLGTATGLSELGSQHAELLAFVRDDDVEAVVRMEFINAIITTFERLVAIAMLNEHLLFEKGTELLDEAAAVMAGGHALAYVAAVAPEQLALVPEATLSRLEAKLDRVAPAITDHLKKQVAELAHVDEDTITLVAPGLVASFATANLFTKLKRASGNPKERKEFGVMLAQYDNLRAERRADELRSWQFGQAKPTDFVIAPVASDNWPASLPEAEDLVREMLLRFLAGQPMQSLDAAGLGSCLFLTEDAGTIAFFVPHGFWMPDVALPMGLSFDNALAEQRCFAWLLSSSTTLDQQHAAFKRAAMVSEVFHGLLREKGLLTWIAEARNGALEVVASGAAGAGTASLIVLVYPDVNEALLAGVATMAGESAMRVAKMLSH